MLRLPPESNKMRVMIITTAAVTLDVLLGEQILTFVERGHRVRAITGSDPGVENLRERLGIPICTTNLRRAFSPFRDLIALIGITREIRRRRPEVVHTHTPKAGLMGMAAAWLCRVPVRVFTLNGAPSVSHTGLRKALLMWSDRISSTLSTQTLSVSNSLKDYAVAAEGLREQKIKVLGAGSSHGVSSRFFLEPVQKARLRDLERARMGIPRSATVLLYVGRWTEDKGVVELERAWAEVRQANGAAYLVVCGWADRASRDCLAAFARLQTDTRVRQILLPHTQVHRAFASADILLLPSHREGFPNVVLEAAAMSVPTIACDVVGCRDAVADGSTGYLVPVRDPQSLACAINGLLAHPELIPAMGAAARERARMHYQSDDVAEGVLAEYRRQLCLMPQSRAYEAFKRVFDLLVSAGLLLVCTPLLGGVAVLVLCALGRPILFRQTRIGRLGQPFTVYKFRTMANAPADRSALLSDRERMNTAGRLMRRASLDELPQLWNILKGDMSLVGPRPLLPQYLARYSERQAKRHEVRPGLTGWAQVNGRNQLSWEDRLELDVRYVEQRSLALDLKILMKTAAKVLSASGVEAEGGQMPEFLGNVRQS